ncbi:MAG: TonB-dependent receptor [Acidobacteria bacterium]|nr:TonB-dependent receptor [Acidobacteriota bacterium]
MGAQAGAGSGAVSGTVWEAGGDTLPDASVELSNPALGLRRVMNTTDDGLFTAPALNPAPGYRLKITRKGFTAWQSAEFVVSIGQTVNFQVSMTHTEDSGQSTGNAPVTQVRELKTGAGTLVTPSQVGNLPSAQRRIDPLVQTASLTGTDSAGRSVIVGQPFSNVLLVDGIAATGTYYYQRGGGIARQLPLDAFQEAQVLTADYPAEFGDAMGGVVNAATRSGSGNYHGALYDYLREGGMSASGRYALGQRLLRHENRFGVSAGGPVLPGKVFFFANAEVWDGQGSGLNRITSPVLTDTLGLTIPSANCKATAAQCAAATRFLQSQMNVAVPLSGRSFTGLLKLDYRRSDRNQFSLEANGMNLRSPNGGPVDVVANSGGLLGLVNSTEQVRYGKAGWTSAPTEYSVNELRFGLFQDRFSDPAASGGFPNRNVALIVGGATASNPHPNADSLSEHRTQLIDNLTITSNTHTVRIGGDVSKDRYTVDAMNSAGTYVYNSLTNFALDFAGGGRNYNYFLQQFGNPSRALPTRLYNLYAMDTWRPLRRVSILAGLRWERPRRPQPAYLNTSYYQTDSIAAPVVDFAPRVAIALQADDRTVVRAGYSWFYAPMPGQLLDSLFLGNAIGQTSITVNPNQTGAPLFPNVLASAGAIPSGTTNVMYAASKLRDPHTQQYHFAVERSLGSGTTVSVNAIRQHGFKLWTLSDVNLQDPTVTKTYSIVDSVTGAQSGTYSTLLYTAKNDPKSAHVYNVLNEGSSWYDAVSVELRQRFFHGLSLQASYTWSHAIDNVGGATVSGFLPLNTVNNDVVDDKADSAFDQRHRAVIDWSWQPEVAHAVPGTLRRLLDGWTLSSITTMASGHPVTPLVMVSGQQFSSASTLYTTTLNGGGGWARVPFLPLDSLFTGPQYNVDARLGRTIRIRERLQAVLQFEAFNALNTQFNTTVNAIAYTATPTPPPPGAVAGPATGVLRAVSGVGNGNAAGPARQAQFNFRLVF